LFVVDHARPEVWNRPRIANRRGARAKAEEEPPSSNGNGFLSRGISEEELMAVDPHIDAHETIAAMRAVLDAVHDSLRSVGTCIAISREQIASSRALLAAVTVAVPYPTLMQR